MALLQGHLLRYKNDPEGAISTAARMGQDRSSGSARKDSTISSGSEKEAPKKTAPVVSKRRVLTVEEVDKMYFNPQPGWDKDIKSL